MSLKKHLEKLTESIDNNNRAEFDKQMKFIQDNYQSQEDIDAIDAHLRADMRKFINETDAVIKEVTVRAQLAEVAEIISLSYIAKKYFNRTRQWLYQRINGSAVNNKPARFTPAEVDILNTALKDISNKIGSVNVSIS